MATWIWTSSGWRQRVISVWFPLSVPPVIPPSLQAIQQSFPLLLQPCHPLSSPHLLPQPLLPLLIPLLLPPLHLPLLPLPHLLPPLHLPQRHLPP